MRRLIEQIPPVVFGALVMLALWPVAPLARPTDFAARRLVRRHGEIHQKERGLALARAVREAGRADQVVLGEGKELGGIRAIDRATCELLDENLVADPAAAVSVEVCRAVHQTGLGVEDGGARSLWVSVYSVPRFEKLYPHSLELDRKWNAEDVAVVFAAGLPLLGLVLGAIAGVLLLWLQCRWRRQAGLAPANRWLFAALLVAIPIRAYVGWNAMITTVGDWTPGPIFLGIQIALALAVVAAWVSVARSVPAQPLQIGAPPPARGA